MLRAQAQERARDEELDAPVRPAVEQRARLRPLERGQQLPAQLVIDRPAVVRVHQAVVPQVVALVDVRHPGHRQLEDQLRERVDHAELRHALRQRLERTHERAGRLAAPQQRRDELPHGLVPGVVRLHPGTVDLGLLDGLGHVVLDARDVLRVRLGAQRAEDRFGRCRRPFARHLDGPRAEQDLVEQQFLVRVRRGVLLAFDLRLELGVAVAPGAHRAPPFLRQLRERGDPRPGVLAALGVVRGRRQHRVRPVAAVVLVRAVEIPRADAEALRLAAHLVERDQPVVNVERRVLQPLGHDRSRTLLELHHEPLVLGHERRLHVRREAEEQDVAQEVVDGRVRPRVETLGQRRRAVDDRDVLGARRLPGDEVGPVDRKARDDLAHGGRQRVQGKIPEAAVPFAQTVEHEPEHVDVVGQRQPHRQPLLLVDERGKWTCRPINFS